MNYTLLSLEQTPPLSVPLRYILTAPLFAVLAALVILLYPDGLGNRWSPPLLGATHFLTLGFAGMVMFGAMQQLLPVLAGVGVPRAQLVSLLLHLFLTLGSLCLGAGLVWRQGLLLHLAMAALGLAVAGFVVLGLMGLRHSRSSHDTVRGMRLAVVAFLITAGLGLYLLSGHALPQVQLGRGLTDLHLGWGLYGWVGLLVIAVAYQVVPMFQLTPNYPARLSRWLVVGLFAALLGWSVAYLLDEQAHPLGQWLLPALQLLVAAGLVLFAVVTFRLQQQRRRRLPDVTLAFWRGGMASLLLAALLWGVAPLGLSLGTRGELMVGVLLVLGFTMSVISGMLYKIVPFLIWLHLNNQLQMAGRWQGRIPNMKQLIPERHARIQFWLHGVMVLMFLGAVLLPKLVWPAALLLLLTSLYLEFNLLRAVRVYRRVLEEARQQESAKD